MQNLSGVVLETYMQNLSGVVCTLQAPRAKPGKLQQKARSHWLAVCCKLLLSE